MQKRQRKDMIGGNDRTNLTTKIRGMRWFEENLEWQEAIAKGSWANDPLAAVYGIDDQHLGGQKMNMGHKD